APLCPQPRKSGETAMQKRLEKLCCGKTVSNVEINCDGNYATRIIFQFTDGSTITIGSETHKLGFAALQEGRAPHLVYS
ncbi:MAG: hypothetical protein Q7S76_00105, partial [bacterium]|nr:hypothetical protein [bacterium]